MYYARLGLNGCWGGGGGACSATSSTSAMRPPHVTLLLEDIVILGVKYGRLAWRDCNPVAPDAAHKGPGTPGRSVWGSANATCSRVLRALLALHCFWVLFWLAHHVLSIVPLCAPTVHTSNSQETDAGNYRVPPSPQYGRSIHVSPQ